MDLNTTFILSVFCLAEDWLEGRNEEEPLRRKLGPKPELSDSEVPTIEPVLGEFLGVDTDEGLFGYFRRHYAE